MALKLGDRIKEMASTSGLADFTLAGAVAGFQPFSSALAANGDTTYYCAVNADEWEIGVGTRTAASALARTTVMESSNANAKVNFSAPPVVFCTVPASQMNIAGAVPAFSAYRSAATQAIPANTWTKIQADAKEYDTHGAYDTVNSRFQPQIAGYYMITGCWGGVSSVASLFTAIYKNGAEYKRGAFSQNYAGQTPVAALVYLNGSTDYVEMWGQISVAQNGSSGLSFTYFQGMLLSPTLQPSAAIEPWHYIGDAGEPAFVNSFANYDANHRSAYYKDRGRVYLKGLVKGGANQATVFTLPAGYRPEQEIRFPATLSGGIGSLYINAAGAVSFEQGNPATWGSLDSLSFRAA